MAEKKPQVVTATLTAGKLIVPVNNLENGNYALRIFPEKSLQEMLYRSTRLMNLNHTPAGFECEAVQEAADQRFEIKNVKTNTVIVCGQIKAVEEKRTAPAAKQEEKK